MIAGATPPLLGGQPGAMGAEEILRKLKMLFDQAGYGGSITEALQALVATPGAPGGGGTRFGTAGTGSSSGPGIPVQTTTTIGQA